MINQPQHPLEHQLIAALERGEQPSLTSLGTPGDLHAASSTLRHSPLMPEFLRLTLRATTTQPDYPSWAFAITLATGACTDLVLLETTCLLASLPIPTTLRDAFCEHTLALAGDMSQSAHTRSIALGAALQQTAGSDKLRYRLLAALTGTQVTDDPEYLRHVARIAGFAYTGWQSDGLVEILKQFADIEGVAAEACVALGICTLHDTLHHPGSGTPPEGLSVVYQWFAKAHQHSPNRPDAILYSFAVRTLDAFCQGNAAPDLAALANDLTQQATALTAWHEPVVELPWAAAHTAHATAWHALSARLARLASSLDEPAWYRPEQVIEQELAAALVASQTLVHTTGSGLEVLLAPRLCTALGQHPGQRHQLTVWLEEHTNHSAAPKVRAILDETAVQYNDQAVPVPHPSGPFPPFTSQFVPLLIEQSIAAIEDTVDWQSFPTVRRLYTELLRQLLLFLETRLNLTGAHPRVGYLSQSNPTPAERNLQADLHDFLYGQLGSHISVEISDIAGGRADISFLVPPYRIVAELKRELNDASFDALQTRYAAQATEYQATDLRLGFLVVLDLTQQEGRPHITELVRTIRLQRPGETEPRFLTIIKVPGNQRPPSAL